MVGVYLKSAVAGAFLLGMATAAMAVTGEFGNRCTMGLAMGKDIQTDCSVNAQLQGKTHDRVYEGFDGQSRQGAGVLLEAINARGPFPRRGRALLERSSVLVSEPDELDSEGTDRQIAIPGGVGS